VPDSVLNKNVALGDMNTTAVDPRGLTTPFPGDMTPGFNTPASMYLTQFCVFHRVARGADSNSFLSSLSSPPHPHNTASCPHYIYTTFVPFPPSPHCHSHPHTVIPMPRCPCIYAIILISNSIIIHAEIKVALS